MLVAILFFATLAEAASQQEQMLTLIFGAGQPDHPCRHLLDEVNKVELPRMVEPYCGDLPTSSRREKHLWPSDLEWLAAPPNRCVAAIMCTSGAYNSSHLIMVRDVAVGTRLLFFPDSAHPIRFDPRVPLREFEAPRSRLYAYRKTTGGGYSGWYGEYGLAEDGTPQLVFVAERNSDDYDDRYSYNFSPKTRPPKGWTTSSPSPPAAGCAVALKPALDAFLEHESYPCDQARTRD